ncbi:ribosomal protein S5 domain 2-like protein [Lentithecium fluviatile CBS 122367]|uniref:Ribosomal RNA-processing protein 43 n=1 Tax=Lentithecium fluviatile CBS 122367 TaxID=1168545 RepID=A0A6G1JFH9_9PLEO|nr:ribosomal protein S5 domain 2-like protein [Lentithecium fluviatile CBS 122367]
MMATTTSTHQPPALSFPRPIFAAVSPHPFLQAHLTAPNARKAPQRANGRTAQEFRTPGINTGSLTHCNGSAVVRLGNTSVVCGARAEILADVDAAAAANGAIAGADEQDPDEEREEIESLRLLVPNVELSTGSTPQHIPGNAPSSFAQTLITRIRSLLLSTHLLRASDLRILYTPPSSPDEPDEATAAELKGYWVLYIDIFYISIDGNAFDAAWLGLLAALQKTLIPHAFWDEDLETILCSDDPSDAHSLSLRGLPIPSTFAVFEGKRDWDECSEDDETDWMLSDPDAFEESVCRESVCVVVDCSAGKKGAKDGILRRVEKSGGGVVDREGMRGLVRRAVERWGVVEAVFSGKT